MIDYRQYRLSNGLRVIHNYDPSSVMAVVNPLYITGNRDETRELTGIAHLFEHLMFGGSAHVPRFDAELERAGGSSNAWTSADFTNFYDIVPAVNIETALHLESDRMLALSFSPEALETQRKVVIEEFKQQCLNRPYGRLMHELRAALYSPAHPYSWPVIGLTPDHIAAVTDADVRRWFYTHYAPDNAVLAITSPVPYDEMRRMVEHWMGDIPARSVAPRTMPDPGFPTGRREVVVHDPRIPQPLLALAIPMGGYDSDEYLAADIITDILAAGRSGHLYRHLVAGGDGTILDADASIIGSEHPGFVMLTAWTADARPETLQRAERLLVDELAALAEIDLHELERTHNRNESSRALSNYDPASRAANLAMAVVHGEDINEATARRLAVPTGRIEALATTLADRPRVALHYIP